jgi:antitoxin YefM
MITATMATDLKANLKKYIERAINGDSIIITRPKSKNVVLISEEEYNELHRIKNNAEYMYKMNLSMEQAKQGKVIVKSMEELEEMANE